MKFFRLLPANGIALIPLLLAAKLTAAPPETGSPAAMVKLTGIIAISEKKALLLVHEPGGQTSSSMILGAGEKEGQIEVTEIDAKAGVVRIRNGGKPMELTFTKDGVQLSQQPPPAAPMPPVPVSPTPPAVPVPVEMESAEIDSPDSSSFYVFGRNSRQSVAPIDIRQIINTGTIAPIFPWAATRPNPTTVNAPPPASVQTLTWPAEHKGWVLSTTQPVTVPSPVPGSPNGPQLPGAGFSTVQESLQSLQSQLPKAPHPSGAVDAWINSYYRLKSP